MTVGSLFAGIGGFDLGFERAGMKVIWQVEIDPYCRKLLERHFPDAERFNDVREVGRHNLKRVEVIAGGFPCQDISYAGLGAGIEGERGGLWTHMFRIVCELRPCYVVVENVAALLERGMGRVLGDLASIGYDAEWDCIRAHDLGASHLRERVFIVAHARRLDGETRMAQERSDTDTPRRTIQKIRRGDRVFAELGAETSSRLLPRFPREPDVARMADGIPNRVDRVTALGNAIVPQIAQWIGERLMQLEAVTAMKEPCK